MKQINKMNATKIFGLILFLIFLSYDASSISFSQLYHFDKSCYDVKCKDTNLLFDKVESKCIYEPIIFEGKEPRGNIEDEVVNIDEFLNLKPEQRGKVAEIYKACVKNRGSEFAKPILQGIQGIKYLIIIAFYCLLIFIQGLILSYLLRKFIKKKKIVIRIIIIVSLVMWGFIGPICFIWLIFHRGVASSFLLSLSEKVIPVFCSSKGFCQPIFALLPYYLILSLFQAILFLICKYGKNEK